MQKLFAKNTKRINAVAKCYQIWLIHLLYKSSIYHLLIELFKVLTNCIPSTGEFIEPKKVHAWYCLYCWNICSRVWNDKHALMPRMPYNYILMSSCCWRALCMCASTFYSFLRHFDALFFTYFDDFYIFTNKSKS